jgi:hypothetical protein
MTASDLVAIIAIGATVALAWINHRDRVSDRDQARLLAREARIQDRRAIAYRAMLVMVRRIGDVVTQTLPMWERVPPPPRIEPPTDDEQRDVAADVGLYGTAIVLARLEETLSSARDFFRAAEYLNDVRLAATPPDGANDLRGAREEVTAKRDAFSVRLTALEAAAREDIGI